MAAIAKPGVDSRYLYYLLLTLDLRDAAVGSAQPLLTQSALKSLQVPKASIHEQRAIASVLGALDDKIELNRKMNATLEATARALFASWFIDFEPVQAKAAGRKTGLTSEVAALFPDVLGNSTGRKSPTGWACGTVLDIAIMNPEVWSKVTRPEVVRYVDLSTAKWGEIAVPETYERERAPSRAQRVLRPGDTIVGTVRPGNGSYALVSEEGLTGSTGFCVLRPLKSKSFTYLAATSKANIERLAHLADGGAYPAIRPEVVGATPVPLPPEAVLNAFDALVAPMLDRSAQSDRESRTLRALRDALLPKLISGELRVRDAERVLEGSA
jgi:type I restriction enzyme S subunit